MNPANDFGGYVNMLADQVSPGPEYRHYVESNPTSMQPKAVGGDQENGWTHALAVGKGLFHLAEFPVIGTYHQVKELYHEVTHPVETAKQRIAMLRLGLSGLEHTVENPVWAYQTLRAGYGLLEQRVASYYQGLSFDKKLEYGTFGVGSVGLAIDRKSVV